MVTEGCQTLDEPSVRVSDVVTQTVETERSDHRSGWEWAALLLMPVVILVVLRVSPYYRLNNGDPFIYVGYANDFRRHVARFGYTYHAVRFGLIFPLRASLLLGPVWGYFILRYLLYLLAIVPLYLVLRPQGTRIALFGVALFVANPVSAESILTTYTDTIVVPVFCAVVCLMVFVYRLRGWKAAACAALAGILAGVSINTSIFSITLLGVSMAVLCLTLILARRYADLLRCAAVFVAGIVVVSVAGMLVYRHMFGDANIYRTTWAASREVKNDSMWRSPSLIWLSTRRYAYAPLLALLLGGVALFRSRRVGRVPFLERVLIVGVLGACVGFYALYQFLLGGNTIETSYYYAYVIGPACLVVAAATGWMGRFDRVPIWVFVAAPVAIAYVAQTFALRRFVVFAIVTLLLCAVIVRSTRALVAGLAAIVAMNIAWGASPRVIAPIAGAGFQYEPHYEQAFGDASDTGFEAYMLASKLPSVVPSAEDRYIPLLFWYRSGDGLLDSVQATYHWQTLTVQRSPESGMPAITPDDLDRLRALAGGFVVLIGRTSAEIDAGVDSLRAAGVSVDAGMPTQRLHYGDSEVFVKPVAIVGVPN